MKFLCLESKNRKIFLLKVSDFDWFFNFSYVCLYPKSFQDEWFLLKVSFQRTSQIFHIFWKTEIQRKLKWSFRKSCILCFFFFLSKNSVSVFFCLFVKKMKIWKLLKWCSASSSRTRVLSIVECPSVLNKGNEVFEFSVLLLYVLIIYVVL